MTRSTNGEEQTGNLAVNLRFVSTLVDIYLRFCQHIGRFASFSAGHAWTMKHVWQTCIVAQPTLGFISTSRSVVFFSFLKSFHFLFKINLFEILEFRMETVSLIFRLFPS